MMFNKLCSCTLTMWLIQVSSLGFMFIWILHTFTLFWFHRTSYINWPVLVLFWTGWNNFKLWQNNYIGEKQLWVWAKWLEMKRLWVGAKQPWVGAKRLWVGATKRLLEVRAEKADFKLDFTCGQSWTLRIMSIQQDCVSLKASRNCCLLIPGQMGSFW